MEIRMSPRERALFELIIRRSKGYLEFGSGGSTVLVRQCMKGVIYSVDSAMEWLDFVSNAIGHDPLIYLHAVDLGPTVEWGYPASDAYRDRYPNYYSTIWNFVDVDSIDCVLVDGRFRAACFARAALSVNPDTVMIVHDYRSRPHYHVVETLADVVAEVEDLTLFTLKPDCRSNAEALIGSHGFDPA
jgi:hypothetical protein